MAKTDRRIERAITGLLQGEPARRELGPGCLDVFALALPFDSASWFALDPSTLLPTCFEQRIIDPLLREMNEGLSQGFGRGTRGLELKLLERLMQLELSVEDGLSPSALVSTPGHVATLHGITGGRPDRTPRYEFYPVPGAIEDELRVLLRDAGETWGMVFLSRGDATFSRAEQEIAAAIGSRLGAVVRMSLLRGALAAGSAVSDPPGLILMADDVTIGSVSPEAERLLGPWTPSTTWHWVSVLRAMRGSDRTPSMVVDGVDGPVTVHATSFGAQEAIIIEQVRPYRLADRLVRAYGLTPRERDVLGGLSRGWSTRQIAFELDLADYTVQDHLRSVFDKVGVRSRKEVLAKLFFDRYLPEHQADRSPSPYGWFLGGAAR